MRYVWKKMSNMAKMKNMRGKMKKFYGISREKKIFIREINLSDFFLQSQVDVTVNHGLPWV